ncbi:MAG: glycosyltransferase family 2 protein [Nitrospirae bacterium]|nr:glycosyltransferase family 2 protein [Nitrospirota bacterium]
MEKSISVVIPNYNKAATIGKCLESVFASEYKNFEVIVVDDRSEDGSFEVIKKFPCKLISLEKRSGTSKARNTGAENSSGEIIFFTDADCIFQKDTLAIANRAFVSSHPITPPGLPLNKERSKENQGGVIIGGTYTRMPYDNNFFSIFQSVYINYSETKNIEDPDYIAAHAMIIDAETFKNSDGFPEVFLPIIEDVEFSHRLRRMGCRLIMEPEIQVQHIFNFSLLRSLKNAYRKSKYWNMYSLKNKDLLSDSGTASVELKTDVASYLLSVITLAVMAVLQQPALLFVLLLLFILNAFISRRLLKAFFETKGILFTAQALIYYSMLYPLPVGTGAIAGVIEYLKGHRLRGFTQMFFLICAICVICGY